MFEHRSIRSLACLGRGSPVRAGLCETPDARLVEAGELVGSFINALGNGLALEKLVDPDAVPDSLYGDMLVLIFTALGALARESLSAVDTGTVSSSREQAIEKKGAEDG